VSNIDMSCELLGAIYESPIVIAPTGSNRAFHPDGELAVARAARRSGSSFTRHVSGGLAINWSSARSGPDVR